MLKQYKSEQYGALLLSMFPTRRTQRVTLSHKHQLWRCMNYFDPPTTFELEEARPFLIVEVKGFKECAFEDGTYSAMCSTLYVVYSNKTSIRSFGDLDGSNFLSHLCSVVKMISMLKAFLRLQIYTFHDCNYFEKMQPEINWLLELCKEIRKICNMFYQGEFPDSPFLLHFDSKNVNYSIFLKKIECEFDPGSLNFKYNLCCLCQSD